MGSRLRMGMHARSAGQAAWLAMAWVALTTAALAKPPEPLDDLQPPKVEAKPAQPPLSSQSQSKPRPPEPREAPRPPEPADEILVEQKTPPPLPWALALRPAPPEPIDDVYAVFAKDAPENVNDLRLVQEHVRNLTKKVVPCTVGLLVGQAQGSGVIISPDGWILTAGHVSGEADKNIIVILPDGRTVRGKSAGANNGIDSGLCKIVDKNPDGGDWPYVMVARSKSLTAGTWCVCTGHPGGYQRGRAPVLRLGRILQNAPSGIMTDCTLVGGDSGGPLFDIDGRVIGINSRIGGPLSANFHVPCDTFRDTWDRLATSEVWGGRMDLPRAGGPYVGITGEGDNEARITRVVNNSPAAKAGIVAGDVVKSFGGRAVRSYTELGTLIGRKKPGDKVLVEVLRGMQTLKLELTLTARP